MITDKTFQLITYQPSATYSRDPEPSEIQFAYSMTPKELEERIAMFQSYTDSESDKRDYEFLILYNGRPIAGTGSTLADFTDLADEHGEIDPELRTMALELNEIFERTILSAKRAKEAAVAAELVKQQEAQARYRLQEEARKYRESKEFIEQYEAKIAKEAKS